MTLDIHRRGTAFPAENDGIGVVVGAGVALLAGRSSALGGHPAEAKCLALLLADGHAGSHLGRAIAGLPLRRVGISLDGVVIILGAAQACVLDVIGVELSLLCTRGALGHSGQAVPGGALLVGALSGHGVQNAHLGAHFVKFLTNGVPNQSCHSHSSFLNIGRKHSVI